MPYKILIFIVFVIADINAFNVWEASASDV